MEYKGIERRNVQNHNDIFVICKQEENIVSIKDAIHRTESAIIKLDMRINGSLEKMSIHIEDSIYWRRFIVGVAVSLVLSIVGGAWALFSLSYNLGTYTKQIVVNTGRLDNLEEIHPRGK